MESSIYRALKQYQSTQGDMLERIKLHGLHEVFSPIIVEYALDKNDMYMFNSALFYILNVYSKESELHILNQDWHLIKEKAAEDAGVQPGSELYDDLVLLKSTAVAQCARMYLDRQKNKVFKHLVMLKDLYEQFVNGAIENITDKDGVTDYDQKMRNSEHANKIYTQMHEWEQRLELDTDKLKKFEDELKQAERKFSLRLEDNLHANI